MSEKTNEKTREDMGGMELLRRLADDVYQAPSLWYCLEHGREGWWGAKGGGESLAHALRSIVDRIEADLASELEAAASETHELKIEERFADDIRSGRKTFEIRREDDRRFEVGDTIGFRVVGSHGEDAPWHALNRKRYRVSYVLRGWGVEDGHAALAVEPDGGLNCFSPATPYPVVAADGKPLIEGEEVYNLSNGWPYVVVACSEDGQVQARYSGHGCPEWFLASRLTHARPEAKDADGLPVHVGDTVYIPEDGSPRKVSKIAEDDGLYVDWIGWYRAHEVRITPPDSQEAIDSDALKSAGDYCKAHPEADALREDGLSCKQAQIAHLLRRQRELDKGGE